MCEKFKFEEMKEFLLRKHRESKSHRVSGKLVDFFGRSYYKKLTDQEWNACKDTLITKVDGVTTLEQLQTLMEKGVVEKWDFYNIPHFRYVMVPNYSETESRIIFFAHHMLFDGIALWSFWNSIQTKPDFTNLPKVAPIPTLQRILLNIVSPFAYFQYAGEVGKFKKEPNPLRTKMDPSLDRQVRFIEGISLDHLRRRCKEENATVNECCQAIMIQTNYAYFRAKGDTKSEKYVQCTAFSNRPFPSSIDEMAIENDHAAISYEVYLKESFTDALAEAKRLMKIFKSSKFLPAIKFSLKLITVLPISVLRAAMEDFTPAVGITYSNMQGPMGGWEFNGVRVKRTFAIGPTVCKLVNSIFVTSMEGETCIGFSTCKNHIEDADEYIGIYKQKMNEFLNPDTKKTN